MKKREKLDWSVRQLSKLPNFKVKGQNTRFFLVTGSVVTNLSPVRKGETIYSSQNLLLLSKCEMISTFHHVRFV